jgi:hypothetical protein
VAKNFFHKKRKKKEQYKNVLMEMPILNVPLLKKVFTEDFLVHAAESLCRNADSQFVSVGELWSQFY